MNGRDVRDRNSPIRVTAAASSKEPSPPWDSLRWYFVVREGDGTASGGRPHHRWSERLHNVQTETIRPIVYRMVRRGAKVYTDSYCICHSLSRDGYQHRAVNHGAGEYALDVDGDGKCEVHLQEQGGISMLQSQQ